LWSPSFSILSLELLVPTSDISSSSLTASACGSFSFLSSSRSWPSLFISWPSAFSLTSLLTLALKRKIMQFLVNIFKEDGC
jgi:hypothetical protein